MDRRKLAEKLLTAKNAKKGRKGRKEWQVKSSESRSEVEAYGRLGVGRRVHHRGRREHGGGDNARPATKG